MFVLYPALLEIHLAHKTIFLCHSQVFTCPALSQHFTEVTSCHTSKVEQCLDLFLPNGLKTQRPNQEIYRIKFVLRKTTLKQFTTISDISKS